MTILLDCDDVLLNWIDGFRIWAECRLGYPLAASGPASWSMGQWLGVDDESAFALIVEFNDSANFGKLEPVDGAVEVLLELANSHPLHVVTACSMGPSVILRRSDNLHKHFGPIFQNVHYVDLGQSKAEVLQTFEPAVWIEDSYKHALAGLEAGHRSFLRRRSHNQSQEATSHPEIAWFTHWEEIYYHLT